MFFFLVFSGDSPQILTKAWMTNLSGPIRCRAPNLEEFIVRPCKSCKFLYLPFNSTSSSRVLCLYALFRPNPAPSAPLVQMDFVCVMNLATLTPEASISSFSRRDISHLWGKAKKQARNKLDMVLVISFKVNPSHGDATYLIIILNSLMFSRTRYRICRSKSEVQY